MSELERTQQLERQLRSANRWLTLALFFIRLACLAGLVAIVLLIVNNWRWEPAAGLSAALALLSTYCKWAAGPLPGDNR